MICEFGARTEFEGLQKLFFPKGYWDLVSVKCRYLCPSKRESIVKGKIFIHHSVLGFSNNSPALYCFRVRSAKVLYFSFLSGETRSDRKFKKSATGKNAFATPHLPISVVNFLLYQHTHLSSVCSYHCHLYPHPENDEERADVLDSLRTRIQDLNNVGAIKP